MQTLQNLKHDLHAFSDPAKKDFFPRFFKTGKGQYAEGDIFIGVTVPNSRKIAVQYKDLQLGEIEDLLSSKIHEERLVALIILVHKFQKGNEEIKKEIFEFYLRNTRHINNWDLVDLSADKIVGGYLLDKKDRSILKKLANSSDLWEKRISIIATFEFIKDKKEYLPTFEIAEALIKDPHDLIQKAVGWMLREVGKRISPKTEIEFLDKHYKKLGRTALRYSIEHFDEKLRVRYMKGEI